MNLQEKKMQKLSEENKKKIYCEYKEQDEEDYL